MKNYKSIIQILKHFIQPFGKSILFSILALTFTINTYSDTIGKQPVKIIFDTDISGDWDDVGALAMLLELSNKGEANILAIGVSAGGFAAKWSPLCVDAIDTYYGQPDIPVGVVTKNIGNTGSGYVKVIAENWPHDLKTENVWDAVTLYRKTLSEQPDSSVVFISVGYLNNMADLLKSKPDKYSKLNGIELVRQKVKQWVCMGGEFPEGRESNLSSIPDDAQYAIENWPVPILFSGVKIGSALMTGRSLARTSYNNPVRKAYEISGGYVGCPHPSWDQTAVLAAIRNPLLYWDMETNGFVAITDDRASNKWHKTPDKRHSYLINRNNSKKLTRLVDDLMADVSYPFSNEDKLVANWKFDETGNTYVVEDASEKEHTGVFINKHHWVKGKFGNAACFSTPDGIMYVDHSDDFIFHLRFGIAFWIYYPDSVPEGNRTFLKHMTDRNKFITISKNSGDNKVCYAIKTGSLCSKTSLTANKWHHITISQNGDTSSIYIDGKLDIKAQIDISEIWGSQGPGPFYIGANVDGMTASDTYIDDLFIFNNSLSSDNVIEIMNRR